MARIFLEIVRGLVLLEAAGGGFMAWMLTQGGLGEKAASAVFLAVLWAILHAGYLIAPSRHGTPRRKLAIGLMVPPALVAAGAMAYAIHATLLDVAATGRIVAIGWVALYVAAGVALYIAPPVLLYAKGAPSS